LIAAIAALRNCSTFAGQIALDLAVLHGYPLFEKNCGKTAPFPSRLNFRVGGSIK